jgi:DNA-binding NarL/FixJ family response regulator
VTRQDGIASLAGYQADAAQARPARGRDGDGPGQPPGSQVPPRPVSMLMPGRGDPATPPARRRAGLPEQKLDPIAAALEVIATSRPAGSRTPSPTPDQGSGPQPGNDPLSALTPRETEVLRRIAEGQNTKNMAREMNVTTETLRTYVRNVLAKLGAHSRLEAAALAVQHVPPARGEPEHDHKLFAALTPREREVLIHLANGSGLREVGKRLHMSPKTLSTHLQNLRNKLGVHSTLEAVALARSRLSQRLPAD